MHTEREDILISISTNRAEARHLEAVSSWLIIGSVAAGLLFFLAGAKGFDNMAAVLDIFQWAGGFVCFVMAAFAWAIARDSRDAQRRYIEATVLLAELRRASGEEE